jgi:hypothetical protein
MNLNLGIYIYIYKRLKWFVKQHQVHNEPLEAQDGLEIDFITILC